MSKIYKLFLAGVFLNLITPLLFSFNLYLPFTSLKLIFFTTLVELCLPLYLYLALKYPEYRPSFNPLIWGLLIFTAINLVSAWLGLDFARSFWGSLSRMVGLFFWLHVLVWFFYLQFVFRVDNRQVINILKFTVWIAVIPSVVGIMEKLGIVKFSGITEFSGRSIGLFGNPIFFGSYLIIAQFLSLWLWLRDFRNSKFNVYTLASLFIFSGILVTGSRGVFLGLMAGGLIAGIVYVFISDFRIKKRSILGIIILTVIVISFFTMGGKIFSNDSIMGRIATLSDSGTQARIIQWQTALRGAKENLLIGTGPENYYYISNKYFDPELYNLNLKWSDKPHNALLEILTASGILGLVSYLFVIFSSIWLIVKSYKNSFINRTEFSLLLGAVTAYQVQNLFVFDTASALIMFLLLLAYISHFWYEKTLLFFVNDKVAIGISMVVGIFAMWTILSVQIPVLGLAYNLNQGMSASDYVKAKNYYDKILEYKTVSDSGSLALRYSNFANNQVILLASDPDKKEYLNSLINQAIVPLEYEIKNNPNNFEYWTSLANSVSLKSAVNDQPIDQRAYGLVEESRKLAPNRIESDLILVNFMTIEGDLDKAQTTLDELYEKYPGEPSVSWKLSVVHRAKNNIPKAAAYADEAIRGGFDIKNSDQFHWLIQYYFELKDFDKLRNLGQRIIQANPNDIPAHAMLAEAYAKMGQKKEAIETAEKLIRLDPKSKEQVEKFIQDLR